METTRVYIEGQEQVRVLPESFVMDINLERLRLREFTHDDSQPLIHMHENTRVRELLIDDQPLNKPGYAYAFIARQLEIYRDFPGLGIWAADHVATPLKKADWDRPEVQALPAEMAAYLKTPQPTFAGWFNLMPIPQQMDEIELGSRLLPAYWGGGFAISGGELLLAHAFTQLKCERLWIVSHTQHRSVDYIAHALGFQREAVRDYCGQTAQYYVLSESRWQNWKAISRRERIKLGIKAYRQHHNDTPASVLQEENPINNTIELSMSGDVHGASQV